MPLLASARQGLQLLVSWHLVLVALLQPLVTAEPALLGATFGHSRPPNAPAAGRHLRSARAPPALLQAGSGVTARSSLGASVHAQVQTHAAASRAAGRGPLPPEAFGAFAQDESTYNHQEEDEMIRNAGWELTPDNPMALRGVEPAAWYHESESAGPVAAWQSHFPALASETADWRVNGAGQWVQGGGLTEGDPANLRAKGGLRTGKWFDVDSTQYDYYGRSQAPAPGSIQSLWDWQKQVNVVNLTCATPGCIGQATVQAFDATKFQGRQCSLSLQLHPTDFDDQYDGERLSYIIVNGHTVNRDCFPMLSGCSVATESRLFTCLDEYPLDVLLDAQGSANVVAKISDAVDDCPYQGKFLLAAVLTTTCYIRPINASQVATPAPVNPGALNGLGPNGLGPNGPNILGPNGFPIGFGPNGFSSPTGTGTGNGNNLVVGLPLQCAAHGCVARSEILINASLTPPTAADFSQCLLNIWLNQTDFDNEEGGEAVEYVKVNGVSVAQNVQPGKNPCWLFLAGTPLTPEQKRYQLLTNYDATKLMGSGSLVVEAKITPRVDECASNGYLLDALAQVTCTFSPSGQQDLSSSVLKNVAAAEDASGLVPVPPADVTLAPAAAGR